MEAHIHDCPSMAVDVVLYDLHLSNVGLITFLATHFVSPCFTFW
jgi:hypothetical protein